MADAFWEKQWAQRRIKYGAWRGEDRCVMWKKGARLHVVCPQDTGFKIMAETLWGGIFRHRTGQWTFPIRQAQHVAELAEKLWPGHVTISNTGEPSR